MMWMPKPTFAFSMLMLAALLCGCEAMSMDDAMARHLPNDCTSAADCGPDQVCLGFECSYPNFDGIQVEITPPITSRYTKTQSLDVSFVGGRLDLSLPRPTELAPSIYLATGNDRQLIYANMTVFGDPRIPDREIDLSELVTDAGRSYLLLPGSYAVRLLPTDQSNPGADIKGFDVRARTDIVRRDFEIQAPYQRLYGEVTSSVAIAEKIAGATIRAYSVTTGLASTVATSDTQGHYELLLPKTEDTFFRLEAVVEDQPAWSFEEVVKVEVDEDREKQIQIEPTSPTVRGIAKIQVLGVGGQSPEPIGNVSVTMTATDTPGASSVTYRLTGTTNASGFITIRLPDGSRSEELPVLAARYTIAAETPVNNPYRRATQTLDLSDVGPGFTRNIQIALSLRTTFSGEVRSPLGRPVPYARVEMESLDVLGRLTDTQTTQNGTFSIMLDPGRYLVVVRPSGVSDANEPLPVGVESITIPDKGTITLPPITLPRGVPIEGSVRGGEDGDPVGGSDVEFFVRRQNRTVSLGRSVCSSSGYYAIVLPELPQM